MRLMLALSWLPRSKKKFSGNLICEHNLCGGPCCGGTVQVRSASACGMAAIRSPAMDLSSFCIASGPSQWLPCCQSEYAAAADPLLPYLNLVKLEVKSGKDSKLWR